MKTSKITTIAIFVFILFMVGLSFYWFEYRLYHTKRRCNNKALSESHYNPNYPTKIQEDKYNNIYQICIRDSGF